jgi:hypothetical protein
MNDLADVFRARNVAGSAMADADNVLTYGSEPKLAVESGHANEFADGPAEPSSSVPKGRSRQVSERALKVLQDGNDGATLAGVALKHLPHQVTLYRR